MLSYFGCDQSQVQRYLTAKSVDEGRQSLLMSAFVKIPLQALVLLTGVLVFVFYLFKQPPMLFNPKVDAELRTRSSAERVSRPSNRSIARAIDRAQRRRARSRRRARDGRSGPRGAVRDATSGAQWEASTAAREDAVAFAERHTAGDAIQRRELRVSDVRHDAAAARPRRPDDRRDLRGGDVEHARPSSNSLATATVIDFYRRHLKRDATDAHYLIVSRVATGFWGLVACGVAVYAAHSAR